MRATEGKFGATAAQLLILDYGSPNRLGAWVLRCRGTYLVADVSEKRGPETVFTRGFEYTLPRLP
jgi:hypothetical protein